MKDQLFKHKIYYYKQNNRIFGIIPTMDKAFIPNDNNVFPDCVLSFSKPIFHKSYVRKQRIKRVFVLTSACNLQCSYCFEGIHDKTSVLEASRVEKSIERMFEEAIKADKKLISFSLFGGEPTMNWKSVERAIVTAQKLEKETGIRCYKAIVTNGVMNIEYARYLAQNMDFVYFSFDGPKSLFLLQRKPKGGEELYDVIFKNAQEVYKSGTYLSFKVTVTKLTINHLKEIDDFFAYNFPTCGRLYQPCMVDEEDELYISFGEFLGKYYQLEKYSIFARNMTTSLHKNKPSDRFCNLMVRNVIYPDGSVLACHRSNMCVPEDEVKKNFMIGICNEYGYITEYTQKKEMMKAFIVDNIEECSNCSLKYHCCGGCATIKLLSDNHNMFRKADYCEDYLRYAFTKIYERLFQISGINNILKVPERISSSGKYVTENEFIEKMASKIISIEE